MTTTFEKARVGDRVWCEIRGWATIISISECSNYPLRLKYDNGMYNIITTLGEEIKGLRQTVFWDEIKYEIPTMPKRMVKKKFSHWRLAQDDGQCSYLKFDTKEQAIQYANDMEYEEMIYPVLIEFEIEVEDED